MAISDIDRKTALKIYCRKNGLSFTKLWNIEKMKQTRKEVAMRHNMWKSRLSSVNFSDDPIPSKEELTKSHSYRAGRFTVRLAVQ